MIITPCPFTLCFLLNCGVTSKSDSAWDLLTLEMLLLQQIPFLLVLVVTPEAQWYQVIQKEISDFSEASKVHSSLMGVCSRHVMPNWHLLRQNDLI